MSKNEWMWEIVYADDTEDGQLGHLPMIHVPDNCEMPSFLLIWEVRSTGEYEPGPEGEDVPVIDQELRQYASMDILKNNLSPAEYDNVRKALGLKPLVQAAKDGQLITAKVRENLKKD